MDFNIVVIGGGHAGIEAAAVSARLGLSAALITMSTEKIGLMSCNPAIGGLAKGQLVREIDALGGQMAHIIDAAGIHFKMLNTSKGPAVWSPRAQADRKYYALIAQHRLKEIKNLKIIEDTVDDIVIRNGMFKAVHLQSGNTISARAVILTAGTFLNGLIHIGLNQIPSGRAGEKPARGISETLIENGFISGRLKTGTPPRLDRDSIDFTRFEVQEPDNPPRPFSFSTARITRRQIPCYIGYTTEQTHDILRMGFQESPMFTGRIKAAGPRYCPSIEDKINRFADRKRHQLFLEPEGYDDPEIYLNGFSTSLPEKIQVQAIHSIPGLEKSEIRRLGYAVEYDFFPPHQLYYTLETKQIRNLYFAGQINGTSGYEEAAAQGLIAGINAVMKIRGGKPLKLQRSEAYIGVMIDDLINKSTLEPYRMFTSRAEFRLLLRQDNADLRLADYAQEMNLLESNTKTLVDQKRQDINNLHQIIREKKIYPQQFNAEFSHVSSPISQGQTIYALLKRPELGLEQLLRQVHADAFLPEAVQEVEFNTKYEGYVQRNQDLIKRFTQYEQKKIPGDFNYNAITALSSEAKEKLAQIRPHSFGQASRISGVTPADLSVLLIHLERGNVSRETSLLA
jgi:tRNA uridine 5-carboxymethylaminomethyl modification enzyme